MKMKLNPTCMSCTKAATLRCKGCKIAYYCCRTCQTTDYIKHKATCLTVRKSLAKIETTKEELIWVHPDIFTGVHTGEFWNLQETRPYMRAQLDHMLYLSKLNTVYSSHEAIQHGKLMLVLCTADDLKVREVLPALYLRIGTREAIHECYQFLHVWNSALWGRSFEMTSCVFHIPNRPEKAIFEPVLPGLMGMFGNVSHTVALLAIKLKLCTDIKLFVNRLTVLLRATIRNHTSITLLRGHALVLTIIADFLRPDCGACQALSIGALRAAVPNLVCQCNQLLNAGYAQNKFVWKAHPEKALAATIPPVYGRGSVAEAVQLVRDYAGFLYETKGPMQEYLMIALATYLGKNTDYNV